MLTIILYYNRIFILIHIKITHILTNVQACAITSIVLDFYQSNAFTAFELTKPKCLLRLDNLKSKPLQIQSPNPCDLPLEINQAATINPNSIANSISSDHNRSSTPNRVPSTSGLTSQLEPNWQLSSNASWALILKFRFQNEFWLREFTPLFCEFVTRGIKFWLIYKKENGWGAY